MKLNPFVKIAPVLAIVFTAATPIVNAAPDKAEKVAKSEEVEVQPGSVATSIRDGVTSSILAKAIKAADLEVTLGGKDIYTVFAPVDEAFTKLPDGALEKLLLPENKEKLRTLLLFHVIPGQFISSSLKDGDLKTASGDKVEIDVDGKKVEVDDAKVVNADVIANNGVIHVIDKVLVPKSLDGFAGLKAD